MIILDTNVLSELMREATDPRVHDWARSQPSESLFTTAVNEAEVFHGLARLASGRRRRELEKAADEVFAAFEGRVLPFDSGAAREFGDIVARRRSTGRPISFAAAEIAAVARARGAKLATRDTGDFEGCGVELANPWAAKSPR